MNKKLKKEFTIDCAKWRSGGFENDPGVKLTGKGETCLLNDEGYYCCLGFMTQQLTGASDEKLLNLMEPVDLVRPAEDLTISHLTAFKGDEFVFNTDFTVEAININDSTLCITTPRERVKLLRELGKRYGLKLKFKNYKKLPKDSDYE